MKTTVELVCDGVSYPAGSSVKKLPKRNQASVIQAGFVAGVTSLDDIGETEVPNPALDALNRGEDPNLIDAQPSIDKPLDWSGIPKRIQNVLAKEGVTDRATLIAKRDELGGDLAKIHGITDATAADVLALLV